MKPLAGDYLHKEQVEECVILFVL